MAWTEMGSPPGARGTCGRVVKVEFVVEWIVSSSGWVGLTVVALDPAVCSAIWSIDLLAGLVIPSGCQRAQDGEGEKGDVKAGQEEGETEEDGRDTVRESNK